MPYLEKAKALLARRKEAASDMPRERLIKWGADSLTDAELLAILLRTGQKGLPVQEAAKKILDKYGHSLRALSRLSLEEWAQEEAVGKVKAITISAVFELAKRYVMEETEPHEPVSGAQMLFERYWLRLRDLKREQFYVLLLNSRNQVIAEDLISEGSADATLIHPRECFRKAILQSAVSIILMHNHPSENPEPSQADIQMTEHLKSAGDLLRIAVLDHIIIGGNTYFSFDEHGLMR